MSTLNVNYITPKHLYSFEIEIDDSVEKTIPCNPLELSPFIYGNDENIDSVIYPGSVKIKFSIQYKVPSVPPNPFGDDFNYNSLTTNAEYYRLNNVLSFYDANVTISKDGVEIMKGYIDKGAINARYEDKSFTLNVLNNFGKLKDLDPRTLDPADYLSPPYDVAPGGQVLYIDLLLTLIQEVYPSITQVILMSDVKSETTYTLLGVPQSVGAGNFGTFNYDYVGPSSKYEKATDIIKDILAVFGCVGIVKENKFLMQSRFYFSQSNIKIYKRQFVQGKGPSPFTSEKLDGLQILCTPNGTTILYEQWIGKFEAWIGIDNFVGSFILGEIITWSSGSAVIKALDLNVTYGTMKIENIGSSAVPVDGESFEGATSGATGQFNGPYQQILNMDNIETLKMIAVGGDPPGVDGTAYPLLVRNIWLYVPAFITGLGYDTWVASVRNSFYITGGTKKALWKCVADEIWDRIKKDRMVYKTDVEGVNWEYNYYYNFEDGSLQLRPRKISYDDTSDTTSMELIEG